jgi:hypothetical protein
MTWSPDMSLAPAGTEISKTVNTSKGSHTVTEFVPSHVWLALSGGTVIKSYWIPQTDKYAGRWHGCGTKEVPIAWQLFVKPEFPAELDVK